MLRRKSQLRGGSCVRAKLESTAARGLTALMTPDASCSPRNIPKDSGWVSCQCLLQTVPRLFCAEDTTREALMELLDSLGAGMCGLCLFVVADALIQLCFLVVFSFEST